MGIVGIKMEKTKEKVNWAKKLRTKSRLNIFCVAIFYSRLVGVSPPSSPQMGEEGVGEGHPIFTLTSILPYQGGGYYPAILRGRSTMNKGVTRYEKSF
jgi:hypothetical protein